MAESIEERLGDTIERLINAGEPFMVGIDAEGGKLNNFWTVELGPSVESSNGTDSTTVRLLGCALFLGIAGVFEGIKLVKEYRAIKQL